MIANGSVVNGKLFYKPDYDPHISFNRYVKAYYSSKDGAWAGLDRQLALVQDVIVPLAHKYNVKLIVCLGLAPGVYGAYNRTHAWTMKDDLLRTDPYRSLFVQTWQHIARTLASARTPYPKVVVAYDLQGEPSKVDANYLARMQETIDAIRSTGSRQKIVVESATFFNQAELHRNSGLEALMNSNLHDPVSPVVYSVHFYCSDAFTGWDPTIQVGISEPLLTVALQQDIVNTLDDIANMQRQSGGNPVFLGEYGASSWHSDHQAAYWVELVDRLCWKYGFGACYIGNTFTPTANWIWSITPDIDQYLQSQWYNL